MYDPARFVRSNRPALLLSLHLLPALTIPDKPGLFYGAEFDGFVAQRERA